MRTILSGFGVAGLLCLPCLLVGGVVSLAVVGGVLVAAATTAFLQIAGLILIATGALLYWRTRRRDACAVD